MYVLSCFVSVLVTSLVLLRVFSRVSITVGEDSLAAQLIGFADHRLLIAVRLGLVGARTI